MAARHPLRVVAPWYRWARQRHEGGAFQGPLPRATRPVFQKYVSAADAVKLFLENPQRSYRFFDDEDRVVVTEGSPHTGLFRSLAGRRAIFTPVRKLYRDTHRRGYLVVAELHCEAPGLPDPSWSHIAAAGFVVRRWVPTDPDALDLEAKRIEKELSFLRALDLIVLGIRGQLLDPRGHDAPAWMPAFAAQVLADPLEGRRRLEERIDGLRQERGELERPDPTTWKLQYWEPDAEHAQIGRWRDVPSAEAETPSSLEEMKKKEKVYPMYRLIPDPRDAKHLSLGARLLFGSVPTGDMDTTATGEPHLGTLDTYEIRCFVQPLKECCSGRQNRADCPDRLQWTAATEPYRIAAHFDPVGTGNTVVHIEMPDMRALAAQPPTGFPLRLQWPPMSKPSLSALLPPGGAMAPGAMTCTTSIPLVTLVATFLLEIFTPIVVNLFRLYHLLYDRFCFPSGGGLPTGTILPFSGIGMEGVVAPEFPDDRADFDAHFQGVRTPTRTDRLVWETVLLERPKVSDTALVGVDA